MQKAWDEDIYKYIVKGITSTPSDLLSAVLEAVKKSMANKISFNKRVWKDIYNFIKKIFNISFVMLISFSFLLSIFYTFVPYANASGFAVYTHGAKELGMLGTAVAHTEGPASIFFNPALTSNLSGTQFEAGATIVIPSVKFTSFLTGKTEKSESPNSPVPYLFTTHQLTEEFTAGLGIFMPFGLVTKWPNDWEGRYITTYSQMKTVNINPNLAWEILKDRLVLSAGIAFLWGEKVMLKKSINLSTYGLSDAEQEFNGDGHGWGYNLGLLYHLTDDLSFGMSYRSGIDLDLKGDVSFDLPPGTPAILRANLSNTSGNIDVHLPPQLLAGISYTWNDEFIFEIGGRWEGWSRYEKLKFYFDQPINGNNTSIIDKKWKDTLGFNLGVKYNLDPNLAVSAGYLHERNPIPDNTFEPSVTSSDKNIFSLGIERRKVLEKFTCALSYIYEQYEGRTKENQVGAEFGFTANGKYKQHTNLIGVSITCEF